MHNFAKEIKVVNIEEELKNSYLDYAMSVIIGRALPDIRDGLKPVHRRVLFAMNILKNDWNKPYKKSARIVGDVIGKYHPHGDAAVYDTIVRMAQPFSLRYMLIDGQGNFGSVDGDSAAEMRYTEVRMSKIAHELLADLEKETVNYISNYDDTEQIPDVMPSRIPNLLINGASGIAVGMATNIPPHNLAEVINACLAYINDENINIDKLMEYIPGPDFPTAAIINGRSGIEDAYRTGRGKIYIRARTELETDNKTNRESIIINEIPYQVNKARLIEKIAELVKKKRIEGIHGLRDESDKDGMRIVIEIKRDAMAEVVLNNLYSLTPLQISFGINMVALHHGQPKILSLKEILSAFIYHRREVVTRRTIFELNKARERAHMLEGLGVALYNIDKVIELIQNTSTPTKAINSLITYSWVLNVDDSSNILSNMLKYIMYDPLRTQCLEHQNNISENYYFTEQQANNILELRLQKLTSIENKKIFDEYKELLTKIIDLKRILNDSEYLMEIIKKELLYLQEQYKDPRRTKIITNNIDIDVEDLINQENVAVTLSYQGYVKYQPITDYEAQRRGGKGKLVANIKEEDFIDCLLVANTHDTILLFSNHGRVYWMKVYQLPEASRSARGRPLINLLPLNNQERITTILPIYGQNINRHVFMATASGIVKKTALDEFHRPRNTGIIAINLNKNDELIGVGLTDGDNEVMLFSAYGKVIRFSENQVRSTGRNTTGVRGIHLTEGDQVVSLIIPRNNESILTVTQNGYGKRTILAEYPVKSRSTQGVISIKVSTRNGKVVRSVQVNNDDQIIMITDAGTLVRIRVSEISIVGRNTQGVRLIRTTKNECVVGLQRVTETVDYTKLSLIKDINTVNKTI